MRIYYNLICFSFAALSFIGAIHKLKKQRLLMLERPNIIFILVDELRYNALSCTGHPFVKNSKH
jgi:hypothetical protein